MFNKAQPALVALALLIPASPLVAQGTSGLEFLTVPLGARAVALGETYTAVADGIEGALFNPASVAAVEGTSLAVSVLDAPDLFTQSLLGAGFPLTDRASLGLTVNYQRHDGIPLTNLDGEQVGEFSPQVLVFSGAFGYRLTDDLSAGITAKWIHSDLAAGSVGFLGPDFDGTASGIGFDLGMTYGFGAGHPVQVGVALLDMGPSVTFNRESDELPTRMRVGVAAHPLDLMGLRSVEAVDLMIVTDGVVLTGESEDRTTALGYGAEFSISRIFFFRLGVPAQFDGVDSRPLRYGLGIAYGGFRVDLARRFAEHPVLGHETHVSFNMAF